MIFTPPPPLKTAQTHATNARNKRTQQTHATTQRFFSADLAPVIILTPICGGVHGTSDPMIHYRRLNSNLKIKPKNHIEQSQQSKLNVKLKNLAFVAVGFRVCLAVLVYY